MKITVITTKDGEVVGSLQGTINPAPTRSGGESPAAAGLAGTDYSAFVTSSQFCGLVKSDDRDYHELEVPDEFTRLEASELHEKLQAVLSKKTK